MLNKSNIFTILMLLSISACGDKAASEASKAKEHFMSEQQKILEQAKEVQDLATEALEKQKKAVEDLKDK